MNKLINQPISKSFLLECDHNIPRLAIIESLLNTFHEHEITYCHWKSNEHLEASLTGDTDLDILFDSNQNVKLMMLLVQLGFKNFKSVKQKQYKDIEDFIGLDLATGKVVHLHAHFRLTMGEVYLKGYQLDFEERILSNRVLDESLGIYCIDPNFELILLYFREALKLRHRDWLMMFFKNKVYNSGNTLREYKWLKQKSNEAQVEAILKTIFKDHQPIFNLLLSGFNRKILFKLSILIKKEFRGNKLYAPLTAMLLRWYREVAVIVSKKLSQLVVWPIVSKRVNPRGGITIAVIGADGSGKSTVIANLQDTFEQKLDVYKIYFGRGNGKMSWGRTMLYQTKKLLLPHRKNTPATAGKQPQGNTQQRGLLAGLYRCIEALLVAYEKHRNLKYMHKAKEKGMLVICDRYPQNQIMGYNDGPLLHYWATSHNPIFKAVAKLEAKVYAFAGNHPPDIVFKLVADAKVVEARKPGETPLPLLTAKIAGVKQLTFAKPCKVVTVDAAQPLQQVLFTTKKEIWNLCP